MTGLVNTVKGVELVTVPPVVVTVTAPVMPFPITATNVVPLFEEIELTANPPILTFAAVAPVRFVPFIVMLLPSHPDVAPKLVIVGGGTTVKVLVVPVTIEQPPMLVRVKVAVPEYVGGGVQVAVDGALPSLLVNVPPGTLTVQIAPVADPPNEEPDNVLVPPWAMLVKAAVVTVGTF